LRKTSFNKWLQMIMRIEEQPIDLNYSANCNRNPAPDPA
jgi:hypothetical protein